VVYASSSSALATGSALSFNGTNLGIGIASPLTTLDARGASEAALTLGTTTTPYGRIFADSTAVAISGLNSAPLLFSTNTATSFSERMRITTTGDVGIGTSSPSYKLDVAGSNGIRIAESAAQNGYEIAAGSPTIITSYNRTTGTWLGLRQRALSHEFYCNGSLTATLDSSGNLGLGVTPSAQFSTVRALQIGQGAILEGRTNGPNMSIGANFYLDTSAVYRYPYTDFASRYTQATGSHLWYTAASGTAGNTISFTQAMTLDASGRLGLGTTSPSYTQQIQSATTSSGATPAFNLVINRQNSATEGLFLGMDGNNDSVIASNNGALRFGTVVTGTFGEKARITSDGNLLVGTTTAAGKLTVSTSENTFGGNIAATNASYSSTVLQVQCSRDTSNATYYLIKGSRTGVADVFRVADSGNVTNTNNSYGAISDVKLKENIVDASPKLADLMQVKVRNYNMIGDTTKQIGVVAQELETVFPSMVDISTDRDEEGNDLGTTTKSVKYSVFVPMLVKAIQEQQAIIESLKARLDAANL
jgi:hypothetical protein